MPCAVLNQCACVGMCMTCQLVRPHTIFTFRVEQHSGLISVGTLLVMVAHCLMPLTRCDWEVFSYLQVPLLVT